MRFSSSFASPQSTRRPRSFYSSPSSSRTRTSGASSTPPPRPAGPATSSEFGRDQSVVRVPPAIENTQAVGGRVAKHHEAVARVLELERRLLDGHRLDVDARRLDHP